MSPLKNSPFGNAVLEPESLYKTAVIHVEKVIDGNWAAFNLWAHWQKGTTKTTERYYVRHSHSLSIER